MEIVLVNNTGADLREFDEHLVAVIREGKPLPEEIADLLDVRVIRVDGKLRGIINWR